MYSRAEGNAVIKRKSFVLRPQAELSVAAPSSQRSTSQPIQEKFNVLVINSSQEMAKEITMQLNLKLPGCSITYAPSIELAQWIIAKREVNLIVSSPMLPDGSVRKLQEVLKSHKAPPDLLVVGLSQQAKLAPLSISGYRISAQRAIQANLPRINRNRSQLIDSERALRSNIKNLGADLRNDLNNPLQEIVAMVFVAKAAGQLSEPTSQALEAIDKAAKNLAVVVRGLEDKIQRAAIE